MFYCLSEGKAWQLFRIFVAEGKIKGNPRGDKETYKHPLLWQ